MRAIQQGVKRIGFEWVIFWLILLPFIYPLLRSVVTSGAHYIFDNDEVLHSQFIYLLNHGAMPYRDFFSNHTVIFHWIISPLFQLYGYSLETMQKARELSVGLFFVRVGLTMFLVKRLFNWNVAFLFCLLFLLDPFMMFVGMQFRPDGMAITWFVLGAIALTYLKRERVILASIAGLCMGIALLIQLKVLPILAVTTVFLAFYSFRNGFRRVFLVFVLGCVLPFLLYFLYWTHMGLGVTMIVQVFFDSVALQRNLHGPFGFLYQPNNAWVYGLIGKPVTWVYVWCLPLLAAAGIAGYVNRVGEWKTWSVRHSLAVSLALGGVMQWLSLFAVGGVFAQYFLAHTWIFAIFAAWLLAHAVTSMRSHAAIQIICVLGIALVLVHVVRVSTQANLARPTQVSRAPFADKMREYWDFVPEGAAVFPNVLFRPLAYPLTAGYIPDLGAYPQSIAGKMPLYSAHLQRTDTHYIIVTDDDFRVFSAADPQFSTYMQANFTKLEGTSFWKRVK